METLENFGNTILLKDRVYNVLKTEIVFGRLQPGQVLNILDLASKMNVSSAPIREALSMLSKDGLVVLKSHKQATVAEGTLDDLMIALELRKMLEPFAAKLSVNLIPQQEVDRVRKMLENFIENPANEMIYIEADMALHELLHSYAGSALLSDILNRIKLHTMNIRYIAERASNESAEKKAALEILSTEEHMKIIDALSSRDPDRVYNSVLQHLDKYIERNIRSKS